MIKKIFISFIFIITIIFSFSNILKAEDIGFKNVYNPNLGIDFVINSNIGSVDVLNKIRLTTEKPANAFLHINNEMYITDLEGNSLNIKLKNAITTYLNKVIPVIMIDNEEEFNSFYDYYKEYINIIDMAVCGDVEVLKLSQTKLPKIRRILDTTSKPYTKEEICYDSSIVGANCVLISNINASREDVSYIQARFKNVWVYEYDISNTLLKALLSGSSGVVSYDFELSLYEIKSFIKDVNGVYKTSYNIAHRGLPYDTYENSLEGFIDAYNQGATHIEIDGHITKDDEIVVIHDSELNRTTNGTGTVENMTKEQISQYKITKNISSSKIGSGVDIPFLDDVFNYFKDLDIVIIFEIKSESERLITKLKSLIEEYHMENKVVVISKSTTQLNNMRKSIPYIPIADLNTFTGSTIESSIGTIASSEKVIDTTYTNDTSNLTYKLAVRGYSSWYWTYNESSNIVEAYNSHITGITNNHADSLKDYPQYLSFDNLYHNNYLILSNEDYKAFCADSTDLVFTTTLVCYGSSQQVTPNYERIYNDGMYLYYDVEVDYVSYRVYSDIVYPISIDDFISLEDMYTILNKDVKDLTEEEKIKLSKMNNAYYLYMSEDQKSLDFDKIGTMYDDLMALRRKEKSGCNNGSVISFLSLFVILSCTLFIFKKKN